MLEIMQLYVSSFWVWLGLTIAGSFIVRGFIVLVGVVIAAVKGDKIKIDLL
ncbi:MAG: hypothetical protein ABJ360_22350 [Roseobacter sp.]